MFETVALGELLIDFVQNPKEQNMQFMANPGGAPANVLACMSKLGKKTAFIGKVGDDIFGNFLSDTLKGKGINTDGLVMSTEEFTTLAFVALDDGGNRSFSFARKNSADVMLESSEVKLELIGKSRIFHCGTLSLTHPCSRTATLKALEFAKENGVCISVDPNLRLKLWENEEDAKSAIKLCLEYADIIKISDYELNFLYGDIEIETAAERIAEVYSPKALFITCGSDGAYMYINGKLFFAPCLKDIKVVDTTGAGDCFCGAALSKLLDYGLEFDELSAEECKKILSFANTAANLSTAKYGAIPSMPDKNDIEKALKKIET